MKMNVNDDWHEHTAPSQTQVLHTASSQTHVFSYYLLHILVIRETMFRECSMWPLSDAITYDEMIWTHYVFFATKLVWPTLFLTEQKQSCDIKLAAIKQSIKQP